MVKEQAPDVYLLMQIERMKYEDVEQVAALDEICFPTPWSVSAYATETHNPAGYYIVARENETIIGYAGEWLIMDEAHITTIGVAPEHRGKKIGERLLVDILEEAIHRGARRATLEVRKNNTVAQNLYVKYHFHAVSIRKGYYTNNNEDAIVMWIDDMWDPGFLKNFRKYKEALEKLNDNPRY
ncbi:MAG: ribosomal protein S18-alanine N-acetyltransferase [Armatimonadota bacterium]